MSTAALSYFSVELLLHGLLCYWTCTYLAKQARQIEAFLSAWLWSLTHPRLACCVPRLASYQ